MTLRAVDATALVEGCVPGEPVAEPVTAPELEKFREHLHALLNYPRRDRGPGASH